MMNRTRKTALVAGAVAASIAVAATATWAWTSKWSPTAVQREVVRKVLNDPESAQFRGDFKAPRGGNVWCGEVNARNRMGGLVGFTKYIATVADDRQLAEFTDEVVFDDNTSASSEFTGRWRAFCTPM